MNTNISIDYILILFSFKMYALILNSNINDS